MSRPKRDLFRLNINVPSHIIELVDEYAAKHGLNRSTAVVFLLVKGLGVEKEVNL